MNKFKYRNFFEINLSLSKLMNASTVSLGNRKDGQHINYRSFKLTLEGRCDGRVVGEIHFRGIPHSAAYIFMWRL